MPDIQIIDIAHCLFVKDPDGFRIEVSFDPAA